MVLSGRVWQTSFSPHTTTTPSHMLSDHQTKLNSEEALFPSRGRGRRDHKARFCAKDLAHFSGVPSPPLPFFMGCLHVWVGPGSPLIPQIPHQASHTVTSQNHLEYLRMVLLKPVLQLKKRWFRVLKQPVQDGTASWRDRVEGTESQDPLNGAQSKTSHRPSCAELENAGPGKATIGLPRGDRPVATDGDHFFCDHKADPGCRGGPGGEGTTRRASPALCHSAKSSGERRAAGGPGEGRQVGVTVDPLCPKAV